jgi:maltose O-acetyltransferase
MTDSDTRSQKQRMLDGDLYLADDAELQKENRRALELAEQYNQSSAP